MRNFSAVSASVFVLGLILVWTKASAEATDATPIDKEQIAAYLEAENFDELEIIARHVRDEKLRYSGGAWQLHYFYSALVPKKLKKGSHGEGEYFKRIGRWKSKYPDSVTWRIVAALAHKDIGWGMRGSGWGSTVTEEGWSGLEEHLNLAWELLEEGHRLAGDDPELYALAITVAMGLSGEKSNVFDTGAPDVETSRNLMERLFLLGVAIEPTYNPLYFNRAVSLLPRWGGAPGEVERFAARSVDKINVYEGEAMYARISNKVRGYVETAVYLDEFEFSWTRIKQGYLDNIERFPESTWWTNNYAYFACLYKDRDTAQDAFDQIGEFWDKEVWRTKYRYDRWRNWAESGEDYPMNIPLQAAYFSRDDLRFLKVVQEGWDPDWTDEYGQSVLHLAVRNKNIETARWLIDEGAEIDSNSASGRSILQRTTRLKDLELLELLLKAGADPDIRNNREVTSFYYCISTGKLDAAKMLLEYGADIEVSLLGGWRPLHIAVREDQYAMVEFLLDEGVEMDIATEKGQTPLALSRSKGHARISNLLRAHGASLLGLTPSSR